MGGGGGESRQARSDSDGDGDGDDDGDDAAGSEANADETTPPTEAPNGALERTQESLVRRVQQRVAAAIEDAAATLTEQQERERELRASRDAAAAALKALEDMNSRMAQQAQVRAHAAGARCH